MARISLQKRLLFLSLIVFVVPALIINLLYFVRERERLRDHYEQLANAKISYLSSQFESAWESLLLGRQAVVSHVLTWIEGEALRDPAVRLDRLVTLERRLVIVDTSLPMVDGITVLDVKNHYAAGSIGSIDVHKIWQSYRNAAARHPDSDSFFVGPRKADYYGRGYGSNGTAYSYYLRLNIISSPEENIVIQFDIPSDFLRTALAQGSTGIISSLRLIHGKTTFASYGSYTPDTPPDIARDIGETGFQIQAQLQWPPKDFQKNEVAFLAIVISLITLLYTFTISMVLGRSFARPMVTMSRQLHEITRSDTERLVSVPQVPELSLLARDINAMLTGIRELHREVVFRERSQHEAEMKALQAQINPHFLFNSLETFRGLALAGETKKAADAGKSLAKILRYTIRESGYESGLNEEIESVENYLTIQKLRFGERIESSISIHGAADSVKVPRLILQPLVENVFVHAMGDSQSTIRLSIDIDITPSRTGITIRDNGKGISRTELEDIQRQLALVKEEQRATKILEVHGLMNVQQRLHLAYGRHSRLRVSSVPWRETEVSLELGRIPEEN